MNYAPTNTVETEPTEEEEELAHRQALKYGEDLARIYVAERAKREKLEIAHQMLSAVFASAPKALEDQKEGLVFKQVNQG